MASGSIRGITIEFDSNTSKLTKGIKSVESQSTGLQKQINAINKSLKFDSANTELTAQKMTLLQNAAASAATEVEDLKNIQSQMDAAGIEKSSAAYRKVEQEIAILESKTKSYRAQYEQAMDDAPVETLKRQYQLLQEDIEASDNEVKKLEQQQAAMKASGVEETDEQYVALSQKIEAARQKNKELKESLDGIGKTIAAKEAANQVEELGEAEEETAGKSEKLNSSTTDLQNGLNELQSVLVSAGLISAVKELGNAFKDCVETNMGFEQTMSQVQALSGATGDDLTALSDKAKELGANTKFTAQEAAEGFSYMALAGWDATDMLSGIDGVINLAAAAEMDLGEASDIVTDYLTAFGWAAEDSGKFVDEMTYAMSHSNTNVSQLGEAYKAVAATASSMGYSVEDTTAAIMVMSNAGLKGSEAGTALNAIMTRLATNTKDCADELAEYGVQIYDDQGNMRSLSDILTDMSDIWYNLSDAEQANLAKVVAGTSHYSALQTVMNGAARSAEDGSSTFLDYADALSECDGAASDMAETMQENLAGSITKFDSAMDGLKNTIGEQLSPALGNIVDDGTDLVSKINEIIGKNKALVPVITAAATALGSFTTAMSAAMIAKKVADAIAVMGTAVSGLLGPIGLASIALGGIVAMIAASSDSLANAQDDYANFTDTVSESADAWETKTAEMEASQASTDSLMASLRELMAEEEKSPATISEINSICQELNDSVDGLNISYDEQTDSLSQNIDSIDDYIDALFRQQEAEAKADRAVELKGEIQTATENLTAAQERLNYYTEKYNEGGLDAESYAAGMMEAQKEVNAYNQTIEDSQNEIDQLEGEINELSKSNDENADATGDAADATEDLADSAEETTDALTEEEEAAKKAHDAIYEVGEACIDATGSGDELMDTYDSLKATFDANKDACDPVLANYVELQLEQLKLVASTKQLQEQLPMLSESYSGLASALDAAGYSVDEFVSSYNAAFSSMVSGFDEIELNTENNLQKWISSMDQRSTIQSTWNDNMSYLVDCVNNASTHPFLSASPAMDAAIAELMNGGVETYGTAAAELATAIQNGDTATINAVVASITSAADAAEQTAIIEFSEATGVTQAKIQELIDAGAATVSNGEVVIQDAAAAMAAGVPEGIASQTDTASSSVDGLVQTAGDTFLSGTAQQAFEYGGEALDQYTASGIEESAGDVTDAAVEVVGEAADSAQTEASTDGENVGYWFDLGLARGIRGHSGVIISAAQSAARAAYDAACAALDVGSPSKKMKEVGRFFSEGMAIGIDSGSNLVQKAATDMAKAAGASAATTTASAVTNNNHTSYGGNTYTINVNGAGGNAQSIANEVMSQIRRTLVRA